MQNRFVNLRKDCKGSQGETQGPMVLPGPTTFFIKAGFRVGAYHYLPSGGGLVFYGGGSVQVA